MSGFGPILAVKLYRVTLEPTPAVPALPCLDHEAMLHEGVAPHVAVYIQDGSSGESAKESARADASLTTSLASVRMR